MEKLKNWFMGPRSASALIVLVALFVALFANTSFFSSAARIYPLNGENLPFVASLLVFILSIFILILSVLCHRTFTKPVLIVFLLLSAVIAYFMNHFGVVVDRNMIQNVVETHAAEAFDLLTWPLVIYVCLLGVLPSLFVLKAPLIRGSWKKELGSRAALVGLSVAALLAIYLSFSANYTSLFRAQRSLLARINPAQAMLSAGKLVRNNMKSHSMTHLVVGADAKASPYDRDRELIIMVIGETARADHFSLNGYKRETNPLLKKENVVNFPDFWSCGTSTAQSVPCMFSHLTRKNFDSEKAKAADNALDILKRVGVAVLWRDNNSSSKGVADRVTYEHYMFSDKNTVCDTECRDEGMLVGLQEFIDAHPENDVLIVLHSMGNHGPAYYKRYPASFEKFTPVCKTSDLGACSLEEIVNAYDNAVLYTDYFLTKVIKLLKQNDDNFETAMFYVSDHGESLGENGLYLHGLPWFFAPDAQKHVPAIMWFGRKFNTKRLVRLEQRRKEQLSHDNIFSTLLGLFEISSDAYDAKLDILDHARTEHW